MNAYLDSMRRYASFSGRSTRSQFWLFELCLFVLLIIGLVLDNALGIASPQGGGIFTALIYLAHLLPAIAVTVRRLHDIDRSGWWILIAFVPLVGAVALLVFACTASTAGANRFGPPEGTVPVDAPQNRATANRTTSSATVDQLERLTALRASGAIDETEYLKLKADVLAN